MESINHLLNSLVLFQPGTESLPARLGQALSAGHSTAPVQSALLSEAVRRGWQGNLWHCALAQTLAESSNPFSLSCERRPAQRDSLYQFALRDMSVYHTLFALPFEDEAMRDISDFHHLDPACRPSHAGILIQALAEKLALCDTPEAMLAALTAHYEQTGLGMLGLEQVFRVDAPDGHARLIPVENRVPVSLEALVGYESQKALLLENTLAFLRGHRANNVLLYGDAGTGKSTSIQSIANEYAPQGLRLIELYKHQFSLIPDLLSHIKGRNYRFILFLDDLSFEENEVEYKHLKAVMEGGGEAAPENVLIYATSNRRHLIKETWKDRNDMEHDGDIHRSDTMEEKLSLAARFGLQIYYPNPSFEEYHSIVKTLAGRIDSLQDMNDEQLRAAASTWQVRHGSRSGRTAQQFVNDLLCRQPDES